MKQQISFRSLVAVAGLLSDFAIVQACSVCISGSNDPTAEAFNASVLFLMFTPYLVVGSIAGVLFFVYRRAAVKREQEPTAEPIVHLTLNQEESAR